MSDESTGGFLQFPLCGIAGPAPFSQQLRDVFGYGVVKVIVDSHDEVDSAHVLKYSAKRIREDALQLARKLIGFDGGNLDDYIAAHDRIEGLRTRWQAAVGPTCWVRLRKDLYFDARDGDPTEAEARVLIGLYSMIGDKSYAKVGWPMIQARAAGWTRVGLDAMRAQPTLCGPIYSRGKIDRTCLELMARGLVYSFTFNRGERFWSNRLTAEQIATAVCGRKAKRDAAREQQRQLNERFSQQIEAARLSAPAA